MWERSTIELPKKIKVYGHDVKVLFPYNFRERYDLFGQCDWDLKEIRISELDSSGNKRPESSILVTFLHEILHVVDFASGQRIFNENEKAIEGISEGLFQVLSENKIVF